MALDPARHPPLRLALPLPRPPRSLSILLTYVFSKSPLFLSLVRLLRNLTALLTQVGGGRGSRAALGRLACEIGAL
jgi:hypothetical protein